MDEIINNQRPSSDKSRLGYEPKNNDEGSIPITPIYEVGTRSFTNVLKSPHKERDNIERVINLFPMSTKELHCLEDLSLQGIKLYFWGIVIFVIIMVKRLEIENHWKTIILRKIEDLSRTLKLTV